MKFFSVTGLVTELLERREEKQLAKFHRQLARLDLIVLDELGYVPFTKAGAELLFEVVSKAYERTSLMVTTNLPFENWVEIMGSERMTGALIDRLTHRVHILEANGQSFRLTESKKRLRRQRQEGWIKANQRPYTLKAYGRRGVSHFWTAHRHTFRPARTGVNAVKVWVKVNVAKLVGVEVGIVEGVGVWVVVTVDVDESVGVTV